MNGAGGLARRGWLLATTAIVTLLGGGWLLSGARSAVDWSAARAVVLESDDWGLCGFVPHADSLDGLRREDLARSGFPPVYWGSTLEDSAAVADLCTVLSGCRGRDGLPAVFQPNYIVSSLSYEPPSREGDPWVLRDLPELPAVYERPGLFAAVGRGIAAGVWYPELHGRFHYDPERRREAVGGSEVVRDAAARGILLFPGSERAWELGPWRPREQIAADLDSAMAVFTRLFGRAPGAVIAPDYVWSGRCEDLWSDRGLRVVQAKREQRHPERHGGLGDRALKVAGRALDRVRRQQMSYLERNCRLETAQHEDPAAAGRRCIAEVQRAWRRGEPAIIETHRVNFAHVDPGVARQGRESLEQVLTRLAGAEPGPLFLTSVEVAQAGRRGTSWSRRGDRTVVRNLSHGRKPVWVPPPPGAPASSPGRLILLAAGEVRVLDDGGRQDRTRLVCAGGRVLRGPVSAETPLTATIDE
ncbi:MAG: hypothetical protein R6X25_04910 [Candidatus Krumholzibacteriia bacterium]